MMKYQVTWLADGFMYMTEGPATMPLVGQRVTFTVINAGAHVSEKFEITDISHELYLNPSPTLLPREIDYQQVTVKMKLVPPADGHARFIAALSKDEK